MLLNYEFFFVNTKKVLRLLLEVGKLTLISKIVLNNKTYYKYCSIKKKQITKKKAQNNHSNVMPNPMIQISKDFISY